MSLILGITVILGVSVFVGVGLAGRCSGNRAGVALLSTILSGCGLFRHYFGAPVTFKPNKVGAECAKLRLSPHL
jgi:hypothetical protein